jgi:hypothetical protein
MVTVAPVYDLGGGDLKLLCSICLTRVAKGSCRSSRDTRRWSGTPVPAAPIIARSRVSRSGRRSREWEETGRWRRTRRFSYGGGRRFIGFGGRRHRSWRRRAAWDRQRAVSRIERLKTTGFPWWVLPVGLRPNRYLSRAPDRLASWAGLMGCGLVRFSLYFFCLILFHLFSICWFLFEFDSVLQVFICLNFVQYFYRLFNIKHIIIM